MKLEGGERKGKERSNKRVMIVTLHPARMKKWGRVKRRNKRRDRRNRQKRKAQ